MALSFPANPTDGQTYTSGGTTWTYEASRSKWVPDTFTASSGGALDIQEFNLGNGTYTWTKPATAKVVRIEAVGAGGGGAYRTSTSSAVTGGGGGGLYVDQIFDASSLQSNLTIYIGAGGFGRAGSDGSGGDGEDTIIYNGSSTAFPVILTAYGGKGGKHTGTTQYAGMGGNSGGDIYINSYGTPPMNNGGYGGGHGGGGYGGGVGQAGGNCIKGGGGGGGAGTQTSTSLGGVSIFHGNGGRGSRGQILGEDGGFPGGGGGAAMGTFTSTAAGNGADGHVIIYSW